MPTDIVMPQMGESIVEGTITKWLKKPGDKVQRDEPLFEISTDKVDAEIPAPASGVLQERTRLRLPKRPPRRRSSSLHLPPLLLTKKRITRARHRWCGRSPASTT